MSKGPDFPKFYPGRRRSWMGDLLFSALVMMSVCLSASREIRIHWYIPDSEATRLGLPIAVTEIQNLPRPPLLPRALYLIRDNMIIIDGQHQLPDLGVATGITSNWLITETNTGGAEVAIDSVNLFYQFTTYSNDSDIFKEAEITSTMNKVNLLGVFTSSAFTITFPCTAQKEGFVNFTLNFKFTSVLVAGLHDLEGRGFNLTGSKYCNCSVLHCNQENSPGSGGGSFIENRVLFIVVGSILGLIMLAIMLMIVLVIMVTFCYHCKLKKSFRNPLSHFDDELRMQELVKDGYRLDKNEACHVAQERLERI